MVRMSDHAIDRGAVWVRFGVLRDLNEVKGWESVFWVDSEVIDVRIGNDILSRSLIFDKLPFLGERFFSSSLVSL